jgi:5-formyltetrahydrofolate cyclo-ligase
LLVIDNNADIKKSIRQQILKKRDRLSKLQIYTKSLIIQRRIINSYEFKWSKVIGAYFPIGSEVKTQQIINFALKNYKIVGLPKAVGDQIIFYKLPASNFERNALNMGKFGIKEPSESFETVDFFDLLIIPGVAFDKSGNRLGYGRGYYDRFLAGKNHFCSIGLGFELQLVNQFLPHSKFDQKLDAIATERRMLYF